MKGRIVVGKLEDAACADGDAAVSTTARPAQTYTHKLEYREILRVPCIIIPPDGRELRQRSHSKIRYSAD
jgi:hypothetical protein